MNKLNKLLVTSLSLSVFFLLFSLTTYASEEPVTEDQVIESPADAEPVEEQIIETPAEEEIVEEQDIETPAEEETVEEQIIETPAEEETTEVEPSTATITVNLEEEFIILVQEDGTISSIEATTEEGSLLLNNLILDELTLEESIHALLTTVENEEVEASIFVLTQDEALLTSLEETLVAEFGEVVESILEEVDEELEEERPEFIEERFKLAEEFGITPGKMNLLEKLATLSEEEIDYSVWADQSIKDIMKAIMQNKESDAQILDEEEEEELKDEETKTMDTPIEEIKPLNSKENKNNGNGYGKSKGKKK